MGRISGLLQLSKNGGINGRTAGSVCDKTGAKTTLTAILLPELRTRYL